MSTEGLKAFMAIHKEGLLQSPTTEDEDPFVLKGFSKIYMISRLKVC